MQIVDTSAQPLRPADQATQVAATDAPVREPIGKASLPLSTPEPRPIEPALPHRTEARSADAAALKPHAVPEHMQATLVAAAADVRSAPHAELEPVAAERDQGKQARPLKSSLVAPDGAQRDGRSDSVTDRSAAEPLAHNAARTVPLPATSTALIQPERPRTTRMDPERPRDRSTTARGGGPVEVRIGTVTLQVRSPPPAAPLAAAPAPPPAERRDIFAAHRHYLRAW